MAEMPETNPYAVPTSVATAMPTGDRFFGAYQDAKGDLVVQNNALLPDICMKCGRTTDLTSRATPFTWAPPLAYVTFVVCNPLIGLIVYFATRKRGTVNMALCTDCRSKWQQAKWMVWGLFALLFVGPFLAGLFAGLTHANDSAGGMIFGAFLVALVALIVVNLGVLLPRSIRAVLIKNELLTLRGTHPDASAAVLNTTAQA